MGMTQPVISMEWTSEDSKVAGIENSNGVEVATDYFSPTADNPMGQGFYEEYKKRHGEEPDFYAANYYEAVRSEEHTSELQSLMRISYAVFCLNKKKHKNNQ